MRRVFLFLAALTVSVPALFAQPPATDPDVAKGMRQVDEGDYDAAIVTLDAAARRLSTEPAKTRQLSQAYLYLGIAYVAKGHEAAARAKFRDALAQVKDLSLSPDQFSPKIIDLFEAAKEESVRTAPRGEARPAADVPPPAAAVGGDRGRSITVPLETATVPIEITIDTIEYHSVRVLVSPPAKGSVKVTLTVKASNPGDEDHNAIVKATLLGAGGETILTKTGRRDVEEGEKNKDVKVEFQVPEGALGPNVSCRLDFSVS